MINYLETSKEILKIDEDLKSMNNCIDYCNKRLEDLGTCNAITVVIDPAIKELNCIS